MPTIDFQSLWNGAMRRRSQYKTAAAVLTPEAEQAAVGAPPAGMPPDAGMPPAGGAPMGGAPAGAPAPGGAPADGGQLPPEIMQDQGFIQWLAQQGVMMDQASGQFIDQQSGQPLPPEIVMQAYQEYQAQMGAAQGGAPGGAPAGGAMPPEAGAAPAGPEGAAPAGPEGGAPAGGGDPTQDQAFLQFMQEAMGVMFDPQSGQFMDTQSGQPIPPDMIQEAYAQFQQQMGGGAAPGGEGAPAGGGEDPVKQMTEQLESIVDSVVDSRVSPLMKKLEALDEKLEKLSMMLEAMQDTDDQRAKEDKDQARQLRDEIAADLNPTVEKTASVPQMPVMPSVAQDLKPIGRRVATPAVPNMFDLVTGGKK